MPEPVSDVNRNKDVGGFFNGVSNNNISGSSSSNFFSCGDESLDINVRNLENLSLMDNFSSVTSALSGLENNENLVYFQDFDSVLNSYIDDPKEGNISRTVRVPSSEHVAEIVGRQGCKIKDLRARTNTYIKTPMRTQSPVFVVTGKEEAVLHVMEEIQNAAEHFTHIRASRNQHKSVVGGLGGGNGLEANKPASREGDVMIQVTVPYRVVGLVVGLKGQTIKAIQQDTDTFIVTPNRDKAPIFEIRGQPENVERAKAMILRHIETRTRHCRLQDSTNLPMNWSTGLDETTHGGSSGGSGSAVGDFSIFGQSGNSDGIGSSSVNGLGHGGSMSLANSNGSSFCSNNHNLNSSGGSGGVLGSRRFGSSFSASTSPPASYGSWSGYNMFDQHNGTQQHHQSQNLGGSMTNWSSATSEFAPILGSSGLGGSGEPSFGAGSSQHGMHSTRSHHGNFSGLNMGSMSSSNSSTSISPPQDFISDGPYQGSQHSLSMAPFCPPMGASPPLHGLLQESSGEAADFPSFPLLSGGSSSPGFSKGSLVLGNLFRSTNSGASSSLGMPMLSGSSSSSNSSSCSSSGSSNNSTASPTSINSFQHGEDHIGSVVAAGFATGGTGTAAAAPVCSLGASSSSSFSLPTDASLFVGASSGGIQQTLQECPGVLDARGGGHFLNGELSSTSKAPLAYEAPFNKGSPTPRLCRVCQEAQVVAALVPCGHNLFCMECAEGIVNRPSEEERKCPVCEEKVAGVLRIRA